MKIGMTLPTMVPGFDRALLLEWCQRVEAGPWHSLAAGERIAFPNTEILVTLAAAAADLPLAPEPSGASSRSPAPGPQDGLDSDPARRG